MIAWVVFIAAVAVAAVSGMRFMPDRWHAALKKPAWNPPNWVFGPVWSILYLMIAVSGWLVWRAADDHWSFALTLWTVQLMVNAAWSWLFFRRHRIDVALADTATLFVIILAYIAVAAPLSTLAAVLFVPYAVWVAFATTLNFRLWRLNPDNVPA